MIDRTKRNKYFASYDVEMVKHYENEVPMLERDYKEIWQVWSHRAGTHAINIENAVSPPLPDCLMMFNGLVVFTELKMLYGKYIYTGIFQLQSFSRMSRVLRPWQISIAVGRDEQTFDLYTIKQIESCESIACGNLKIKIDLTQTIPFLTIANEFEFQAYLEQIRDKAFNRKPKPPLPVTL